MVSLSARILKTLAWSALALVGEAFLPLIRHAGEPHAFASSARQEVDTDGEADPGDTHTDEKSGDPDHRFHEIEATRDGC